MDPLLNFCRDALSEGLAGRSEALKFLRDLRRECHAAQASDRRFSWRATRLDGSQLLLQVRLIDLAQLEQPEQSLTRRRSYPPILL